MRIKFFTFILLLFFIPFEVYAQEVKHIAGDELIRFLTEKPLSVMLLKDRSRLRFNFKPDGTMYQNSDARYKKYVPGKWTLDENKIKVCIEWDDKSTGIDKCYGFYQEGEDITMFNGPQKNMKPFGKILRN